VRLVGRVTGQPQRRIGLDRRGEVTGPAFEVGPCSVGTLLRADPARRLLELLGMPFQREGENIPVLKPPPTRRRR